MPKTKQNSLPEKIPAHVAIIMDGNGRWAAARRLPRMAGHRAGTENLRRIITACVELGIKYLTIYAFSTENWRRPGDEVQGLIQILAEVLQKEIAELHKEGVRIIHIGRLEGLSPDVRDQIIQAVQLTKNNNRLVLNVAWNYGGRDEIVHAVQQIVAENPTPEQIDEALIRQHLYTFESPEPDLVIRTSGEMRTSNFLLWQSAYSEWYFTEMLWPDFDKQALITAIHEFNQRSRRFGGRTPEDTGKSYAG